ncbi:hypothetical protein CYMTET_45851 [Cymbomonas tetramitiformis]|uniref:Uncharacterized protein n=1 Tax=Cymbomonas tetramitiformis TaxID=36881 RepID=A0AAE0EY61_9CHLO|nr:hypothetical protein CYMTET_45851 [Cymbomonas tetramitiformis]
MGYGAPPLDLRPNLLLLAYFLGFLSFGFAGATGLGERFGGGVPPDGAQPAAVRPSNGLLEAGRPLLKLPQVHNPHGWTWFPGPSHPQVVVPGWDWAPPSPGGAPPSPDHDPEEVEQPALNGDHGSARRGCGFYVDDHCGVGITAPLHRTDNHGIADIFTRPLPPQALFYANPSFYGIELRSEGSNTDSGYGSGMDEVG